MGSNGSLQASKTGCMHGRKSPVVLAAYPAPFRTDTRSVHYVVAFLSFAIALLGATQLFLGEENAVVTQGYYGLFRFKRRPASMDKALSGFLCPIC